MTAAENLANELHAELDVVTCERDNLKLQLDEAQAVIDAVRRVRRTITAKRRMYYDRYNETDDARDAAVAATYGDVRALLDEVDGL